MHLDQPATHQAPARPARPASVLPDPQVHYVGPVAVWSVPRPRTPRLTLRGAATAWLVAIPLTGATLLWLEALGRPLWPFGRRIEQLPEILLRYEITGLAFLVYATLVSLPLWWRMRRLARRDVRAIDDAMRAGRWEQAALLLHRYGLLMTAIWRRLPARALAWDGVVRRRLPRHRRMHLYWHRSPVSLPPDPTAGFAPVVLPPPAPSGWAALGLLPVAFLVYVLLMDVAGGGAWQRLVLVNAVLLMLILVGYSAYFVGALLGKSQFYRFAPGVFQVVRYGVGARTPQIEAHDLRASQVVLDCSSRYPALTITSPDGARHTFRLPRKPDAPEAVLRAVLSTAPIEQMPEDQLVE